MDSHRASIAVAINAQGVQMLPGMELMACQDLAVPMDVMQHVVRVESSNNPYAIGVVGGRLLRQPANLREALATVRMLERRGFNFSLGLAQVNRHNLARYGLATYEQAFRTCPNLRAGARILADCHARAGGNWGDALSCYYSGNFVTGYRHGYVQKVLASMASTPASDGEDEAGAIQLAGRADRRPAPASDPMRTAAVASRDVTVASQRANADAFASEVADLAALRVSAAQPTSAAAPQAPASASSGSGVAVLAAGGQPPHLLPAASTPASAGQSGAPRDEAFVF